MRNVCVFLRNIGLPYRMLLVDSCDPPLRQRYISALSANLTHCVSLCMNPRDLESKAWVGQLVGQLSF